MPTHAVGGHQAGLNFLMHEGMCKRENRLTLMIDESSVLLQPVVRRCGISFAQELDQARDSGGAREAGREQETKIKPGQRKEGVGETRGHNLTCTQQRVQTHCNVRL